MSISYSIELITNNEPFHTENFYSKKQMDRYIHSLALKGERTFQIKSYKHKKYQNPFARVDTQELDTIQVTQNPHTNQQTVIFQVGTYTNIFIHNPLQPIQDALNAQMDMLSIDTRGTMRYRIESYTTWIELGEKS